MNKKDTDTDTGRIIAHRSKMMVSNDSESSISLCIIH